MDLSERQIVPDSFIWDLCRRLGPVEGRKLACLDKAWNQKYKTIPNPIQQLASYEVSSHRVSVGTGHLGIQLGLRRSLVSEYRTPPEPVALRWDRFKPEAGAGSRVVYVYSRSDNEVQALDLLTRRTSTIAQLNEAPLMLRLRDGVLFAYMRDRSVITWPLPGTDVSREVFACCRWLTGEIVIWGGVPGGVLSELHSLAVPENGIGRRVGLSDGPGLAICGGGQVQLFSARSAELFLITDIGEGVVKTAWSVEGGAFPYLVMAIRANTDVDPSDEDWTPLDIPEHCERLAVVNLGTGQLSDLFEKKALQKQARVLPLSIRGVAHLLVFSKPIKVVFHKVSLWNLEAMRCERTAYTGFQLDQPLALGQIDGAPIVCGVTQDKKLLFMLAENLQPIITEPLWTSYGVSWLGSGTDEEGRPWWVAAEPGGRMLTLWHPRPSPAVEEEDGVEEGHLERLAETDIERRALIEGRRAVVRPYIRKRAAIKVAFCACAVMSVSVVLISGFLWVFPEND